MIKSQLKVISKVRTTTKYGKPMIDTFIAGIVYAFKRISHTLIFSTIERTRKQTEQTLLFILLFISYSLFGN